MPDDPPSAPSPAVGGSSPVPDDLRPPPAPTESSPRKTRLPRACISRPPAAARPPQPERRLTRRDKEEQQRAGRVFTPLVEPPSPPQLPIWELRSMWELASILNFFHVFRSMLNIVAEFSAEELETALLTPNNTLDDVHIPLLKLWHVAAKTLAEKTAWALAMDRGVDMISINPGLVMVPELSVNSPYLKGALDMYHAGVLVTVDVDFLVNAHVAVYESAEAYGRYLCFNNVIHRPLDATKLAQMLSPDVLHPPTW